jgi:subtilase family serine protease
MNSTNRRVAAALVGLGLIVASLAQTPAASADPIIQFKFADLKVDRADYFYQPITSFLLPKGDYMKFVVKNVGNGAAGPFTVAVKNVYGGATLQTFAISGLSAGASRTLYHNLPDCNGWDKVNAVRSITVDSTNAVLEVFEENNTWSPFICWDPAK